MIVISYFILKSVPYWAKIIFKVITIKATILQMLRTCLTSPSCYLSKTNVTIHGSEVKHLHVCLMSPKNI